MLEGGRSGAIVRPGNSAGSLILDRLTGAIEPQMPKDEATLDPAEINLIRLWIDEGARATPTSPPAPPPWEAPLALTRPPLPAVAWPAWQAPLDRFVATYLAGRKAAPPTLVPDALFARRVYLDVWGLLPEPDALRAFLADTAPDKRARLVRMLLADNQKYAEHWISFWNDLLRNEDGVTYFSESAGRKSITPWLYASSNEPALQRVRVAPAQPDRADRPRRVPDRRELARGNQRRGQAVDAGVPELRPGVSRREFEVQFLPRQLRQQVEAEGRLRAGGVFRPGAEAGALSMRRRAGELCGAGVPVPRGLARPSSAIAGRPPAAVAAIFTDRRVGRMPRTVVNRIWARLFGVGIVANPDEMDGPPWSPALLDWIASDFVAHDYDLKHLIETLLTSRAHQMPTVTRTAEPAARGYAFAGPEVRRLTAEQFSDALGAMTGEWEVDGSRAPGEAPPPPPAAPAGTTPSQPTIAGAYARNWHVASSDSDARARTADPRSGDVAEAGSVHDAAGAGTGEW